MTTVSDGLFQYGGVPVAGALFQRGKSYFVDPYTGKDDNKGTSIKYPLKTLAEAHSRAVFGDTVFLLANNASMANTTDWLASTLTWSTDGVNLIGINPHAMLGQRSRIGILSTATATSVAPLVNVTADSCLFAGISVVSELASSSALVAMKLTGAQRNRFYRCQFSGQVTATQDVSANYSLLLTGESSENIFEDCYIGLDTIIRTSNVTGEIGFTASGSAKPTRNIFRNCVISTYTSSTSKVYITATATDRFTLFENCKFMAARNITSSALPAQVLAPAAGVNGSFYFDNRCSFDATAVETSTSGKVLVTGTTSAGIDTANINLATTS